MWPYPLRLQGATKESLAESNYERRELRMKLVRDREWVGEEHL